MATELEKLTHYMYPFYQESTDESSLQWYIDEYTYADVSASKLWAQIPFTYDVQRFKTGAEETTYASIKDVGALCAERVNYYDGLVKQRLGNASIMAIVTPPSFANGITK